MINKKGIKMKSDYIVKFYKVMDAVDENSNECIGEDELEIIYLTKIDNDNEGVIYDIYVTDSPSLDEYLVIRSRWNTDMLENWEEEKNKIWYCPQTDEQLVPQEIMQNLLSSYVATKENDNTE